MREPTWRVSLRSFSARSLLSCLNKSKSRCRIDLQATGNDSQVKGPTTLTYSPSSRRSLVTAPPPSLKLQPALLSCHLSSPYRGAAAAASTSQYTHLTSPLSPPLLSLTRPQEPRLHSPPCPSSSCAGYRGGARLEEAGEDGSIPRLALSSQMSCDVKAESTTDVDLV